MTDTATEAIRKLIGQWRDEVKVHVARSKHNPIADTLDTCAAEVEAVLKESEAPGAMRTVEQYAADHGVTPPTVRKWIAKRELDAVSTPHGYRIARAARHEKRRRQEKAA